MQRLTGTETLGISILELLLDLRSLLLVALSENAVVLDVRILQIK